MANVRRSIGIVVAVAVVLLGVGSIARTLIRQSRGPLGEDLRKAGRLAKYPGQTPAIDRTLVEGNGVVEPVAPEYRLTADTPGRIAAIYVKEGDEVTKGQLLAEVDNAIPRAQISRAEAELAAASAELQRVVHGTRIQDVNAAAADAVAARARAALADSELARTQELVGKGSLAPAELDTAKRRAEAEGASARAANERAQGARVGSRQEDVSVGQARVKAATAALEEARGVLQRTQIIAPTSGRVLRLKLHVGEFHNPASEPLLVLGDVSRLRVRVDIDERDISRLESAVSAYVTAPAFGEKQFPGKLVQVSQHMGRRTVRVDDPKDRIDVKVLEAVIELDEHPPFVPGMRVMAAIRTKAP